MRLLRCLLLCALLGCVKYAAPAPVSQAKSLGDAHLTYRTYELTYQKGFIPRWERADGYYVFGGIKKAMWQFPESAERYRRLRVEAVVVGGLAGLGGTMLAKVLASTVIDGEGLLEEPGTAPLLVGGLVLVGLGTLMSFESIKKYPELTAAYNNSLEQALGLAPLTPTSLPGSAPTSLSVTQ